MWRSEQYYKGYNVEHITDNTEVIYMFIVTEYALGFKNDYF